VVNKMEEKKWQAQILPLLPGHLREYLSGLPEQVAEKLEEIRLRAGQPLILQAGSEEKFVSPRGIAESPRDAYRVTVKDLHDILLVMTDFSLYARDEELRRGYLSLPGGHRAGFAGRVIGEGGEVRLLREISGIAIRIAREIKGAAEPLLPHVYCFQEKRVRHTLLVSAPQAGKTTMVRDLARLLSDGDPGRGRPGCKVGIVDERSEIAGCYRGEPQLDVGMRSDVLDGCPKALGMMMLVRSMSPQLVVTDELGRAEDARAVEEVINTGASLLATAHGQNVRELIRRPSLAYLLGNNFFERLIVLSRRQGPGTVEKVYAGEFLQKMLFTEEEPDAG
jgi:stage III sporulation protein AA